MYTLRDAAMIRHAWILLLAGCALDAEKGPEEGPLDGLRRTTNAYASFRWKAELTDGKQTVPIEIAWKAPDRGFLRYGSSYAVSLSADRARYLTRQGTALLKVDEEIAALRERYGNLPTGEPPTVVFALGGWEALLAGRGLRATAGYGRLGTRLGWLTELKGYTAEGRVYRREAVEIELREDGFIERAKVGNKAELKALSVEVGTELDDAVFELPVKEGTPEMPTDAREDLVRSLDDAYHRWALETDSGGGTIERLVRVDLARRYEPEKMVAVLRESLAKSVATWKEQNPEKPEVLREKIEIDRGKALGSVTVMEKEILDEFERRLDRYLRGMSPLPPARRMKETAERWKEAVAEEVDRQIRKPFSRVFDEALRN
jgi:hypothetical protein